VADASRWISRAGAFLILLSPFLPQWEQGGRPMSPLLYLGELSPLVASMEWLGIAAWLFLPMAAGAVLLAGSWRRAGPPTSVRALTLALLAVVSFAQATVGSLLLTYTASGPQAPAPSFPLSLALFLTPLILGGLSLARLVGGDFARSSGGFARLSLGVLMLLHGLFLIDIGWDALLSLLKQNGTLRALAGAWPAPAGGLMVAVGEVLIRLRPRVVVDTAPASG
jgi:hypothetical protein